MSTFSRGPSVGPLSFRSTGSAHELSACDKTMSRPGLDEQINQSLLSELSLILLKTARSSVASASAATLFSSPSPLSVSVETTQSFSLHYPSITYTTRFILVLAFGGTPCDYPLHSAGLGYGPTTCSDPINPLTHTPFEPSCEGRRFHTRALMRRRSAFYSAFC